MFVLLYKRLSQNKFEMASIVSFQIEVICIFFKKRNLQARFRRFYPFKLFFRYHKPSKRLLLQDYVQWPASRTQFQPS